METKQARALFESANRLFQEQRYLEALRHLAALDSSHPNPFNILFPMLLCCERLGQTADAREMCGRLMSQFPEERRRRRVREVLTRLSRVHEDGASTPGQTMLAELPYGSSMHAAMGKFPFPDIAVPWASIGIYLGLWVAVGLLLLPLPFLLPPEGQEVSFAGQLPSLALTLSAQYLLSCLIAHTALWTLNKLIHESIVMDMIDVGAVMLLFTLLCFIPVIGWVLAYVKLAEHYALSFMEVAFFIMLQIILWLTFCYLLLPLALGDAAYAIADIL